MGLSHYFRVLHYLRHPYIISRAILRPIEEWESRRHQLRLSEYDRYSVSLQEGIENLTGIERSDVVRLIKELHGSDFLQHVGLCVKQTGGINDSLGIESGLLLYVLARALKPEVVVETGVASGISSSFILKALNKNGRGRLYSIDLHYRESVAVPLGKELGWIIPEELRYRWSLNLGESSKVLPTLLHELGSVNIFLHDSRHTYKTMKSEYIIVWPFLKDGALLSDDVACNDAFLDFADSVKQKPVIVKRIGAIRKMCAQISR